MKLYRIEDLINELEREEDRRHREATKVPQTLQEMEEQGHEHGLHNRTARPFRS
jgi:hypothetical protein